MKKIRTMFLCILAIMFIFPLAAQADMGPKPSVVIDFKGLEGETYYTTLLSRVESTGPYSVLNFNDGIYAHYQEGDEDYEIFLKFNEYQDVDGYYFLQFFQDCTQTQRFSWTYYPPQDFKILLYFPEEDRFLISDKNYERYAFDSYFTAEVSTENLFATAQGTAEITAEKSYDYPKEALSLIVRIILTLAIELGIALLFGFWNRKLFRFIVLVNVVTQIALNLTLSIADFYSGPIAFVVYYVLLEGMVVVAEGILYTSYINRHSAMDIHKWRLWVYALVANAASFILGVKLAFWIPGIF